MDNKNLNKKKFSPKLGNKTPKAPFNPYWIYSIIIIGLLGMFFFGGNVSVKEITWSEFQQYVNEDRIEKAVVYTKKETVEAVVREGSIRHIFKDNADKVKSNPSVVATIPSADKAAELFKQATEEKGLDIKYSFDSSSAISGILLGFAPFILLILIWVFFIRRMSSGGAGGGAGGVFSVGKSKAQLFDKDSAIKVTFKDVAGLSEAKQEVEEVVEFLRHPKKYTNLGGKIPKGALLVGPPGTGKTLLAKAVAGEADVPFFSISGSDFVEMFVGVGASRVRDLFKQAKEKAPSIIFIDEIDAVGRARGKNVNMGSNDERENTLNQLLTEMDGFGSNSGVIILAATNRADILDKALLRAGRFDRQITVDLPDLNDRKEIFKVHLRPIKIDESVDSEFLARQTPGFSGADIANVCNEAALIAARGKKSFVESIDFMNAVDRIVGGLEKRNKIITQEEKKSIAIHEGGHATLSWMLEHANPLVKVTIIPRGKALGAAWYLPEERQITTKSQMLDEMCAILGGRAAEELFIGEISSGAMNDLERVTKQANAMVAYLGMSDKLANLCYYDSSGQDYSFSKPYSEETAKIIDSEVKKLIAEQYARAKEILSKNAEGHAKLAEILIEKEIIYAADLELIFGKRPWVSRSQELFDKDQQTIQDFDKAQSFSPSDDKKEIFIHENENDEAEEKEEEDNGSLNNEDKKDAPLK